MKPTLALKPLVFALTAVLAMAAQAGGSNNDHQTGHHNGNNGSHSAPVDPTAALLLQLQTTAGSAATVTDTQNSHDNEVLNEGTLNKADIENSGDSSNGNMGLNAASGDGNQQDNAAALATADETFIFGSAVASSSAHQTNNNNAVINDSTQNNATLNNSANNGSGNIGINVTAGNFNQQKNNLAVAVSGGRTSSASASAEQTSTNLVVNNNAVQTEQITSLNGSFSSAGTFHDTGTVTGFNAGGSTHSGGGHNDHNSHDSYGSHNGNGTHSGGGNDSQPLSITEAGTFDLAGVWTQQVLVPTGWTNPVVNNATMSGSLNNFSGNGGANVSAGVGNQQSNSLSIAAGCKACVGGNTF